MIKVKNLVKVYQNKLIIKKLNISIKRGESVAIVGPPKSGKTTLCNQLLGLINPTSGEIIVNGSMAIEKPENFLQNLRLVSEEMNLFKDISISKFLSIYSRFYSDIDESFFNYAINLFNVNLDKIIGELTTEEKHCVSLVCAFMLKPTVLILDEPKKILGLKNQVNFDKVIKLLQSYGSTIIIFSENLKEIKSICNRVEYIKNGKLINKNEKNNDDKHDISSK
ncbi:ABC transporter ATP-binding protein [Spiroplasma corruscae]|uniref:ABC transporter ATP-binding protein n=1 Tax=Spiroplasma corruscae TaxID=216934 RepID=A0A222EPI6_9MOLU|nr:ATP-binding cassette domain-containing protein [Spiroplasma corruscae]ASP28203.1 ABC transporter ATP-binding protein [Spiroplasma corruscae]